MKIAVWIVAAFVLSGAFLPLAGAQVPGIPELPGIPGIPPPSELLQPVNDATGQNFTCENINISLLMNFDDIQVDVPGIILGSGKIQVEMYINVRLEIRVISVETIRNLISGSNTTQNNSDAQNATLYSQLYIPADVFRITVTGDLLGLFVAEEEKMVKQWVEGSLPGARVMSIDLEWENSSAATMVTNPDLDLTEPPIVIAGTAYVRYIQYISAFKMLMESGKQKDYGIVSETQKNLAAPASKRGFFGMLAYDFFMVLNATPGWTLNITAQLPPSWSFEYINQEAMYRERRHTVSFAADAKNSPEGIMSAAVASITNRGMVIFYCLVIATILITIIGFPIRWYQKRRLMRKIDKKIASGLKSPKK